jgi:hypothetical protein
MSTIDPVVPAETLRRLEGVWQWWQSLDQGVQGVIDRIAQQAPEAVASVIAGPDAEYVTPTDGGTFGALLWQQLSSASRAHSSEDATGSAVQVTMPLTLDTTWAGPGQEIDASWAEANRGAFDPDAERYRARVIVQDQTGQIVTFAEEWFQPPMSRDPEPRRVTIPVLQDGVYWAKLFVPYEDGVESTPGAEASPAVEFRIGRPGEMQGDASAADLLLPAIELFEQAGGMSLASKDDADAFADAFSAGLAALRDFGTQVGLGDWLGTIGVWRLDNYDEQLTAPRGAALELERVAVSLRRLHGTIHQYLAENERLDDNPDIVNVYDTLSRARDEFMGRGFR